MGADDRLTGADDRLTGADDRLTGADDRLTGADDRLTVLVIGATPHHQTAVAATLAHAWADHWTVHLVDCAGGYPRSSGHGEERLFGRTVAPGLDKITSVVDTGVYSSLRTTGLRADPARVIDPGEFATHLTPATCAGASESMMSPVAVVNGGSAWRDPRFASWGCTEYRHVIITCDPGTITRTEALITDLTRLHPTMTPDRLVVVGGRWQWALGLRRHSAACPQIAALATGAYRVATVHTASTSRLAASVRGDRSIWTPRASRSELDDHR